MDKDTEHSMEFRLSAVHDRGVDPTTNTLYLFGETDYITNKESGDTEEPGVEFAMANRFIKNLQFLLWNGADRIQIHMKTCGGDWQEGIAIYDALKVCPVPVTILSYTHARSMSSLIFQAASRRVMMPNSYFMFHDGTMGIEGTVKQVESAVEFSKLATATMLNIYADAMKRKGCFSKRSRAFILGWLRAQMDKKEDVYLTPEQAIQYGLADEVLG
jgi:ATP-dependent protease ClpP protease subunit